MSSFAGSEFIHRVVKQYSGTITRIAFQYVKNRADTEDIMQDVFKALLKQPPFNGEEHLKAWIIRATLNKSKDCLRAGKTRKTVELYTIENNLTDEQTTMLEELSELPEKDRNIIYLFYYEGYTAKEIAGIMRKKEKAVLMRLSRAREKLKHLLEDEK